MHRMQSIIMKGVSEDLPGCQKGQRGQKGQKLIMNMVICSEAIPAATEMIGNDVCRGAASRVMELVAVVGSDNIGRDNKPLVKASYNRLRSCILG
jgi:hypothetical protein